MGLPTPQWRETFLRSPKALRACGAHAKGPLWAEGPGKCMGTAGVQCVSLGERISRRKDQPEKVSVSPSSNRAQFVLVDLLDQRGALQVEQLGRARHIARIALQRLLDDAALDLRHALFQ